MEEARHSEDNSEDNSMCWAPEEAPQAQMQELGTPHSAFMELPTSSVDNKALRMMKNMGYKTGSGLGKQEQGITTNIPVNTNLGKRGLGLQVKNLSYSDESWDFSQEEIIVEEKIKWLVNDNKMEEQWLEVLEPSTWKVEGPTDHNIASNATFCDPDVLTDVFKAKEIFDELGTEELTQARAKANPFETIRSVFFMNRAALKMANIDAACDFMFTKSEELDANLMRNPVYFADVCAGPGGFTEYILWRKNWLYKGFGMTLKNDNDFKISESTCASGSSFQALYGEDETGDVCSPGNWNHFIDRVLHDTSGGVHFMMSDGGFCVEGKEHLQEVLSKQIYVCQCLMALHILRPKGHFVTKLFDVFTPFSVGLLFLMYMCFETVGIIKPNSSRPANSERYLVCKNLIVRPRTNATKQYLWMIAVRLWEIKIVPEIDILEIVPMRILTKDRIFFQYVYESNTSIGKRQIIALRKLAQFCRNPSLVEPRQDDLRRKCLEYWKIPDLKRQYPVSYKINNLLDDIHIKVEWLNKVYIPINSLQLIDLIPPQESLVNWSYMLLNSTDNFPQAGYYAGLGYGRVLRYVENRWTNINHLDLPKGTLLYGEFVKEHCIYSVHCSGPPTRYSLHVMDAICLGSMDLRNLSYSKRMRLIEVYCKSVNRESQTKYSVRVRPKPVYCLSGIKFGEGPLVRVNRHHNLPILGFGGASERYEVNSILLVKSSPNSTHVEQYMLPISQLSELILLVDVKSGMVTYR